jgi:hypothetical protein
MDHFLVGGSGGGGAGSHPFLWSNFEMIWRSCGGGGGGGGAFGARVGRSLTMPATGLITSSGGSTNASAENNFGTPGGGGSGGTIILQVADAPDLSGLLTVGGGMGGTVSSNFVSMCSKGGDGSPGYLRIEAPGTLPGDPTDWTGQTVPPATPNNIGVLQEQDLVTGVRSNWYRTRQFFPPDFLRYEIEAMVGGFPVTYTDAPGGILASGTTAVRFFVQGAREDLSGQIETITPWRSLLGPCGTGEPTLSDDGVTAFRFLLLFDRSGVSEISVHKVSVSYRPL